MKEELAINPSNYDKHLELIKVCKESGELDELRTARETFAKIFPLTEKLWMEWIADETSLTESEEEHEKLVELYETALGDYLCPDLWLNYCQYALRWLGAEGGLGKFRGLCERAITQGKLDKNNNYRSTNNYWQLDNVINSRPASRERSSDLGNLP